MMRGQPPPQIFFLEPPLDVRHGQPVRRQTNAYLPSRGESITPYGDRGIDVCEQLAQGQWNYRELNSQTFRCKSCYSNTTVYYGIHERSKCIPVDCGVTNLIHDRRSCVDFTLQVEANVARCVHSSVNKPGVKHNSGL